MTRKPSPESNLLLLGLIPCALGLVVGDVAGWAVTGPIVVYALMAGIAMAAFHAVRAGGAGAWPTVAALTVGYGLLGVSMSTLPSDFTFMAPAECFTAASAVLCGAVSGFAFDIAMRSRSIASFALAIVVSGAAAGYATFPQANVMEIRQSRVEAIKVAFDDYNRVSQRWAGDRGEDAAYERWKALRTLALAMGDDPIAPSYVDVAVVDYDVYRERNARSRACGAEEGDAQAACLRAAAGPGYVNALKDVGPAKYLLATLGWPVRSPVIR